jgi:hypothetical protein
MKKKTNDQKKPTAFRSASADDPIYKEGWTVFTPRGTKPPSAPQETKKQAVTPVTGMDYRDQWADELTVISDCAPLTADEVKALDPQQLADYFYVTSWMLRQEGEKKFREERQMMRDFFLRRIERGDRLRPDAV